MYTIRFTNSSGIEEASSNIGNTDKVLRELNSALETLRELPAGAKIEITYAEQPFQQSEELDRIEAEQQRRIWRERGEI